MKRNEKITIDHIEIDYKEVLRYLGIPEDNNDCKEFLKINGVIDEVKKSCDAKAIYSIVEANELNLSGNDIKVHLNQAKKAVIMAVTCGFGTDRMISRLQITDMAQAVIADAAASVAVEYVCDSLESRIRDYIEKEGKYLTGRFSPGYGDLPLSTSRQLLDILNSEKQIGLGLTDGGLLSPIKSVTAILGILDERIPGVSDRCLKCSKRATCSYKKK